MTLECFADGGNVHNSVQSKGNDTYCHVYMYIS